MDLKKIMIAGLICLPFLGFTQENYEYRVKWDQGFKFLSDDGNFKLKFGGRIMNDWAIFSTDQAIKDSLGKLTNGTEFRRVRFFNSGNIYSNINYKLQLDFAGGNVKAKDIFIEITELPVVGNIKIGHFKEPFSLEELTSSKYITFMERPAVTSFNPSRNTGIMLHNNAYGTRVSWQIGWFRNTDNFGNNEDAANNQNLTFRLAGLPFYKEKEHRFLHLGMGYSSRSELNEYSISSEPEAHMAGKYVKTGTISDVNRVNLINGEMAFVSGPFALQGELFQSSVNTHLSGSLDFNGNYVQISYLLTGENKNYKGPGEGFGRINPRNNFNGEDNGIGAWEVALRYSSIDLIDKEGRHMNLFTAGVNWYLNPSVRIMTNYGLVDLQNIGRMNVLQMRFQIDF